MSFSRPDPSSPASIAEATFGTSRRGFDQAEVKDFLRMVAAEFGRLRERERFLERELQAAQTGPLERPVDDEAMTKLLGEESMRVLLTARESANEIREKAIHAAETLLTEANHDAARIREEADLEATRRRADAAADAEAELAMAKQQGREMVNEARAYRERVLSELARRRELAREQIEQLVHGRDRLMQAFERARLVAVDVVAEMQPLGEPNEYVNLSPTTGPLPVMIANSPRPGAADPAKELHATGSSTEQSTDEPSKIPDTGGDLRIVGDDERAPQDTDAETPHDAAAADDAADEVAEDAEVDDIVLDDADVDDTDAGDTDGDDGAAADGETADDENAADEAADGDGADETAGEHDGTAAADEVDENVDLDDDGDVVVSLFARLRADAETPTQADDDADTDDETNDTDTAAEGAAVSDDADVDAEAPEPTLFELRDEELTPLIVASAKKLKRVLADEQNEVLDALRRNDSVRQIDMLVPWASEHAGRYRDAIKDELVAAVHAGSATSRATKRKMRVALVNASVDAANERLETWLVTPLRDRLERCVSEADGDNAVLAKKVRAVYREWKTQHIDETLDDIVRAAHGRGVLAGFDPDTPIAWQVDDRYVACPDCDDNVLAGAVAAGSPFPTGDTFAPAHQGCRCLLVAADR